MPGIIDRRPALALALGALLISFAAVFARLSLAAGMRPEAFVFWRVAFGSLAFSAVVAARGPRLGAPGARPEARAWLLVAFLGLWFAFDMMVWNQCILRVGAGLSTLLGNTQVLWLGLAGLVLFREKAGPRMALSFVLATLGITAVSGVLDGVEPRPGFRLGVLLGVATGAIYATYLLVVRAAGSLARPLHPTTGMALVTALAAPASAAWAALVGAGLGPFTAAALWPALAAGVVAQCAGWILIAAALPKLPASRSGVVLLVQPVLAMVWGAIVFGERGSPAQLAGGLATLAAIWLAASRPASRS